MDDKQKENEFTKGYNEGYLISRFDPETLKRLLATPQQDNPRFQGIVAGRRAHERELFLENVQKSRAIQQQKHRPRMR